MRQEAFWLSFAFLVGCGAPEGEESGPGNKWGDLSEDWIPEACNWATVAGRHFEIDYMIVSAPLPQADRTSLMDLNYEMTIGKDATTTIFAPLDYESTAPIDEYTVQNCASEALDVEGPQWNATAGSVHMDATFVGADSETPCEEGAMVHYDVAMTMTDVYLETEAGDLASIESLGPIGVELSVPFCDQ